MSTANQDKLDAINVLNVTGKESEWDHWSEMLVALSRARGFAGILLGTEKTPRLIEKNEDHNYELNEADRKEKKRKYSGRHCRIHKFAVVM